MTRIQRKFASTDNPDQRAENIVAMLGLSGDPAVIAQHAAIIAECIRQYQEIDVMARLVK